HHHQDGTDGKRRERRVLPDSDADSENEEECADELDNVFFHEREGVKQMNRCNFGLQRVSHRHPFGQARIGRRRKTFALLCGVPRAGWAVRMKLEIPDGDFGAYIFDLDGTLIDTMPLHYQAWDTAMRHAGLGARLDEELFYSLGGVPTRKVA